MILQILRAFFVLLMAAAGWYFLSTSQPLREYTWLALTFNVTVAVLIICIDILAPRRKLQIFAGTFLGLFVGMLITYALSFVVKMLADQYFALGGGMVRERDTLLFFINLVIGLISCYLCISFVMQTKDDFRFIIPYVEFRKQTKGNRPVLLDTSVLVDGRISDITATGILDSQMIVPRFVLEELQQIADSADKLKRARGRRGLDILTRLQNSRSSEVMLYDSSMHDAAEARGVDIRLLDLAKQLSARILTTDFNLNKVAQLRGVDVININDLAGALRPVVLPGERMVVRLVRAGEEAGQGVGYLEDGTMVVVEHAREHLNEDVEFTVTKLLQTSAGRMIFGRADSSGAGSSSGSTPAHQRRPVDKRQLSSSEPRSEGKTA